MEQQLTVSISERKHPVLAWFWISGSKLKQSALNIVPFGSESGCYHKYLLWCKVLRNAVREKSAYSVALIHEGLLLTNTFHYPLNFVGSGHLSHCLLSTYLELRTSTPDFHCLTCKCFIFLWHLTVFSTYSTDNKLKFNFPSVSEISSSSLSGLYFDILTLILFNLFLWSTPEKAAVPV